MTEKGKLIVISGPSGAGKSTVVNTAIRGREDMCFSTSVTTRSPRPGEVDGRDYFFITPERFREMVERNELLEHAEYVAHSYGTPRAYVEQQMEKGFNVPPRIFGEKEEFMHAERATLHSEGEKNCWLEITLSEGKNREIRRMLAHLGYEVMRLVRIQFDKYTLGILKPGEIKKV